MINLNKITRIIKENTPEEAARQIMILQKGIRETEFEYALDFVRQKRIGG